MNGKGENAVFDWSDIVSMSQSEFVLFCATNCELPPLKQQTLVVFSEHRKCLRDVSEVVFLNCVPFLWKSK